MTGPRDSVLAAAVLGVVAACWAPSLSGGWVWDDHTLLAANPALGDLRTLLATDVWSPTGRPRSDLYRPLVMLSHAVGQAILPGALVERLGNLALHLVAVALVAGIARQAGSAREAAWLVAGLFGLHAGSGEAVAWITGRHDLLPAVLVLGAWLAWARNREWIAGGLLACAPFAKEPYVLAPVCAAAWMLGARRVSWPVLGTSVAGSVAYLVVRSALDLPLPAGAALTDPVGSTGALFTRGLSLLVLPASADAAFRYEPAPVSGIAALVGLAILGLAGWGRPSVAAVLAPMPVLVLAGPASAQIGMVADRYFYLPFAGLAVAAARPVANVLARAPREGRLLWLVLPALGAATLFRATDWRSDAAVFGASYARDPDNPYAAFHVAHDLHSRSHDCRAAVPLYRQALAVEKRAGNNLLGCLVDLGLLDEALTLGPEVAAADPENANPAANLARAGLRSGDLDLALRWAEEATRRDPGGAERWELLAEVHARRGEVEEEAAARERAGSLRP